MGARTVAVKRGFKHIAGAEKQIDNPYAHLAVSVIIQAWLDLKNLGNADRANMDSSVVDKWEVLNFFRSGWCELLLSCQSEVTYEQLETAVAEMLNS